MSDEGVAAATFYRERVPAHFNALLEAQRAAGADAVVAALEAVDATLCVVVHGAGTQRFILDVDRGVMRAVEQASHRPFLTLHHDEASLAAIERESGDSILGLLGGLAGLGEEMRLTNRRIENLIALDGSILFEVTGERGFRLRGEFGAGPFGDAADCTLRLAYDTYRALRAGETTPEDAFLAGHVEIEGDMQRAFGLAFAVTSEG